jgi:hypothetical protein
MNAELLGCVEDHAALLQSQANIQEAVRIYAAARPRGNASCCAAAAHRKGVGRRHHARACRAGRRGFDAAWAEGRAWQLEMAIKRALAPSTAQRVTA